MTFACRQMSKHFKNLSKTVCFSAFTGIASLAISTPASASTTFYAVQNIGGTAKIVSINPLAATGPTVVNDTGLTASTVSTGNGLNAFAYEPRVNGLFFINSSSNTNRELYFGSTATNGATLLGNLNTVLNGGNTANLFSGAYYNKSFYAIVNNNNLASPALVRVPITFSGGVPVGIGTPITTSVTNLPSLPYGDIAIDPNTGILYGVSSNPGSGPFFGQSVTYKIDLLNSNTYSQIAAQGTSNSVPGLQLAFNSSNNVLYGVDTAGNWVTVNTSNGTRTSIAPGFLTAGLTDLAGGGVAVPGPLPILGAGIAFSTSRKLRKRVALASAKS